MSDDGERRGRIVATTDRVELEQTGHAPLVWATAVPAPADPDTWLENSTVYSRCVRDGSETFDNGDVLGSRVSWSDCGGRKAVLVQVAARSKRNDDVGIAVQVMLPRADDELVDQILDSIEILREPPRPEPSSAGSAPIALDRDLVAEFVIHEVPADVTLVVDDTHGIAVAVPPEFTETNTLNDFNDDGSRRPTVIAAPNLTEFLRDGETGVLVIRLPHVDPATLLANTAYSFCAGGGYSAISNGSYKGIVRLSEDCSGPIDRVASIALVPADQSSTILLTVALPDDDLTVLQIALASVELLEPRFASAPAH